MKTLPVCLVALALLAPALAFADVGARVDVLGVGVGAHVGGHGVGRAHMSAPSAPVQVLVIAVLAQGGMSDMWLRRVLVWIATA
jgi:hypothetical protein